MSSKSPHSLRRVRSRKVTESLVSNSTLSRSPTHTPAAAIGVVAIEPIAREVITRTDHQESRAHLDSSWTQLPTMSSSMKRTGNST